MLIKQVLKDKARFVYTRDCLYHQKLSLDYDDPQREELGEKIKALDETIEALDNLAEKLADLDYNKVELEEL